MRHNRMQSDTQFDAFGQIPFLHGERKSIAELLPPVHAKSSDAKNGRERNGHVPSRPWSGALSGSRSRSTRSRPRPLRTHGSHSKRTHTASGCVVVASMGGNDARRRHGLARLRMERSKNQVMLRAVNDNSVKSPVIRMALDVLTHVLQNLVSQIHRQPFFLALCECLASTSVYGICVQTTGRMHQGHEHRRKKDREGFTTFHGGPMHGSQERIECLPITNFLPQGPLKPA